MGIENGEPVGLKRRDFLALAEGLVSAMALGACLGAGTSHAATVTFAESQCGDNSLKGKRLLVTYASKYGSTGGIADAIGQALCTKGATADILLIKNVLDLSPYQGVIVGSPVYMGKWLPEATDFVHKHAEALRPMPVAYFLACMTLREPTQENMAKALAYLDPVLKTTPEIKPVGIGAFAGALDYSNLSWVTRRVMKSKDAPEGDFRDWKAIRAWAEASAFAKSMTSPDSRTPPAAALAPAGPR